MPRPGPGVLLAGVAKRAGRSLRAGVKAAPRALLKALKASLTNGVVLSLLLLVGMKQARELDLQPVQRLRIAVFDLYQKIQPREQTEPRVLIVDLDDRSLAEVGQWPWPRRQLGQILDTVMQGGAIAFGFDVLFPEPDRLSPDRFAANTPGLEQMVVDALNRMPNNDDLFAEKVKQYNAVLGIFASPNDVAFGPKPRDVKIGIRNGTHEELGFFIRDHFPSYVGNIEALEAKARGRGLIIVPSEGDNIIRRVPTIAFAGDRKYLFLSFELLRASKKGVGTLVRMYGRNDQATGVMDVVFQGPNYVIPTDQNGRIWPHFARYDGRRYIPAVDILTGATDPAIFKDKFVILGASAAGLRDIRSTPVNADVPGVEVHAQVIESVLDEKLLLRPAWVEQRERALPLFAGLAMLTGMFLVGARWTIFVFLTLAAVGIAYSWNLFATQLILLDTSYSILAAFLVYLLVTYTRFTREESQRRYIKSTFGFFLSPALVDKLAEDPGKMKLGGESKELSILFSDVRGFTTISEVMTAEQLTQFMNRYLSAMTDIAQDYGAYIDKYIGDAIMAFWNAPLDDPRHAANACTTVLLMRKRLAPLNTELEGEFRPLFEAKGKKYPGIAIGMGINTGPCVVGNMGSTQKFNYSVLGDAVNLASRLEGQTKGYHVDNLIGETTRAQVPEFAALECDLIRVKGKLDAVRIFTLLGGPETAAEPEFRMLEDLHVKMLAAYRAQDWDEADRLIAAAAAYADNYDAIGLHDVYRERIADYRTNPPGENWDGVYVATSK